MGWDIGLFEISETLSFLTDIRRLSPRPINKLTRIIPDKLFKVERFTGWISDRNVIFDGSRYWMGWNVWQVVNCIKNSTHQILYYVIKRWEWFFTTQKKSKNTQKKLVKKCYDNFTWIWAKPMFKMTGIESDFFLKRYRDHSVTV